MHIDLMDLPIPDEIGTLEPSARNIGYGGEYDIIVRQGENLHEEGAIRSVVLNALKVAKAMPTAKVLAQHYSMIAPVHSMMTEEQVSSMADNVILAGLYGRRLLKLPEYFQEKSLLPNLDAKIRQNAEKYHEDPNVTAHLSQVISEGEPAGISTAITEARLMALARAENLYNGAIMPSGDSPSYRAGIVPKGLNPTSTSA